MNEPIKPVSMMYKQLYEKVAHSGNWKDHRGDVYNTCVDQQKVRIIHVLWQLSILYDGKSEQYYHTLS